MLTLYEKKSVDRIIDYLSVIQESYQSELNMLENDILRTQGLIKDAHISKKEVQATLDSSYMVLSSSQVAKSQEFAEIDSFDELIKQKELELEMIRQKKVIVEGRLAEVVDVISCAEDLKRG